jgi:hypothetical protein
MKLVNFSVTMEVEEISYGADWAYALAVIKKLGETALDDLDWNINVIL